MMHKLFFAKALWSDLYWYKVELIKPRELRACSPRGTVHAGVHGEAVSVSLSDLTVSSSLVLSSILLVLVLQNHPTPGLGTLPNSCRRY